MSPCGPYPNHSNTFSKFGTNLKEKNGGGLYISEADKKK
jgi:hypothetical protein